MSLLGALANLATGDGTGLSPTTYTVTRRLASTFVAGEAVRDPSPATLTMFASIQPAAGLQRVIGGAGMVPTHSGQHVDDVRVAYTATKLYPRSDTYEPDEVTFEGDQWTVFRVERWELAGEIYYRCTMTRQTEGGS